MSVLTQTFEAKMRHLTVENRQLRRNDWNHFHERRTLISKSLKILSRLLSIIEQSQHYTFCYTEIS